MSNKKEWPVSPADYLSDENVIAMTIEQEGMYWRLMMHCWTEGAIPKDAEQISKICKGMDVERVKLNWQSIKKCWRLYKKNPDYLVHPRIDRDLTKIKNAELYAQKKEKDAKILLPVVEEIFDHYVKVSGKTRIRLNQQKRNIIRRAIERGWKAKELKEAISNLFADDWSGRLNYSTLDYCIGNWAEKGDMVEKWIHKKPNKNFLDDLELN